MIVLSLFDGMSCGQMALERAGFRVDVYYASEIDKHAIKVTQKNYPNTIQLGDVLSINGNKLGHVDLLIGGSPCQGFSFAGKGLNFEDPRSKLFFEFVRIYKELKGINPSIKFLLENVEMKREHELVISRYMGVNPIKINSALVSAQNRERLYWTNINQKPYGLFGDMFIDIKQPKDKKILLRDILQINVDEKYYIKKAKKGFEGLNVDKKSKTRRSGGTKSQTNKHNFDIIKVDINGYPKKNQNKASCFTAGGNSGGNHSDMDLICIPINAKNKTLVNQLNKTKQFGSQPKQQNRVYDINGQSPALLAQISSKTHAILDDNYLLRRLTEIECERLQTVPDNYTNYVSSTQRYRMLGNGWNVDTIVHILNHLK